MTEDDCPEGDEELDGCRNVSTLAHFLTFGIVVKKFIVAVPFARRIASMLESEGMCLVWLLVVTSAPLDWDVVGVSTELLEAIGPLNGSGETGGTRDKRWKGRIDQRR